MNIVKSLLYTLISIIIFNQPLLSFSQTIDPNLSPFEIPMFVYDGGSNLTASQAISLSSITSDSKEESINDEFSYSNLSNLFKENLLKIQDEHDVDEILLDCVEETRPGKKIVSNLADNYIARYFHLLDVRPVPDLISNGIGNNIVTDDGEIIVGNDLPNCINGKGGDDNIQGRDGSDKIFGNNGNDTLQGGPANDEILGGLGADFLFGDEGDDFLLGGSGNDTMMGGKGDDVLEGFFGADHFMCGDGDDVVLDYFPKDDDDIVEVDCEIILAERTNESPEQVINGTIIVQKTLKCFVEDEIITEEISTLDTEEIDCNILHADVNDFEIVVSGNGPNPPNFTPAAEPDFVKVTVGAGEYSVDENSDFESEFIGHNVYTKEDCEGIIQNGQTKICKIDNTVTATPEEIAPKLEIIKTSLECTADDVNPQGETVPVIPSPPCSNISPESDEWYDVVLDDFSARVTFNGSFVDEFKFDGIGIPTVISLPGPGEYEIIEVDSEPHYESLETEYSGSAAKTTEGTGELSHLICKGDVGYGETLTCNIDNTVDLAKIPPVITTLEITKINCTLGGEIPAPCGPDMLDNIEFTVTDSGDHVSGTKFEFDNFNTPVIVPVTPGSYKVEESIKSGSGLTSFVSYSGDAASPQGEFNTVLCSGQIEEGETLHCDITNLISGVVG